MRATKSDRLGSIQGCRCWAAVARPRPCLPLQLTSTQVVPSHMCVGVVCLVWSGPVLPNHRRPSARRPSIFRPFCISFGLARAGRQRGAPVTSTPSGPSGLSGPSSVRLLGIDASQDLDGRHLVYLSITYQLRNQSPHPERHLVDFIKTITWTSIRSYCYRAPTNSLARTAH